ASSVRGKRPASPARSSWNQPSSDLLERHYLCACGRYCKRAPGVMSEGITVSDRTPGILNPGEGLKRFDLRRIPPAPDLAALVDWYWIVRWSLMEPFEQEVLPHPCVNVSFEARGSAVHGMGTRRQAARLQGEGRVVAAKFKPGGFYAFTRFAMRGLVDRIVP